MELTNAEHQALRRTAVQDIHRRVCYDLYQDDGAFALKRDADWRGHIWHAMSFLHGDAKHIRRANGMLRYIADKGGSDFWSSAVASVLARFAEKLDHDVATALRKRLAEFVIKVRHSRYNGYNDNFPSMAALTVIVGAELTDQPALLSDGLAILRSLQELLVRRGVISEYASPTYSAITMTCLAEIVELSHSDEARDLARRAEHRIWTELASHLHLPTSFLAGPHSRAYLVDLCAHPHNFHIVAYQAFGESIFVNPLTGQLKPRDGQILHGGGTPEFVQSHVGWHTTPTYHIPDDATELALNKRYPFTARASAEHGAFPRNWSRPERHATTPTLEYQAGESHLHTYMTEDFAVGVADRPFLDSYQHSAYHLTYRRRRPAGSIADLGTVFTRYIVNDRPPRPDQHMPDEGRPLCVAHEGAAMVLYTAKPAWTHTPPVEDAATEPVTSLKLSIVIPCFFDKPDELWLGDRQVESFDDQSVEPISIFIKDGPVHMAFHPLISTDLTRAVAVRMATVNGFAMIDLINYRALPRTFNVSELMTCHNGFVAEISDQDAEGFAEFRQRHASPCITDQYEPNTGMRECRYERDGMALAMKVSHVSEGIKFRMVNGRLAPEPKFEASGLDAAAMPWM